MSATNEKGQISDILFDLGNVLVRVDGDAALARMMRHLPPEAASLMKEDPLAFKRLFDEPKVALETGRIDFDEFFRWVSDHLQMSVTMEEFQLVWCSMFSVNSEMVSLGERLSRKYGTWLVSNTSRAHYEWIINQFPQVAFYRGAALSYELGVMKPDAGYYEKAIAQFGIDPARAVFVDDLRKNVDAAVRWGFRGIVFENREQCIEELARLGVTDPGCAE